MLPDVAGFERELDYAVPAELAADVRAGSIVRVPLQGRTVRGWVLAFPVEPPDGLVLRPLAKVVGWGPEPSLCDLAGWAAWRWAGRRRSLLVTASPLDLRQAAASGRDGPLHGASALGPVGAGGPAASRARRQRRAGRGRGSAEARQLVQDAWRAGTHVLRLPPVYSATDLVEAAAEHGPVLVVAPTNGRASAGCAALRRRGAKVALLPGDWALARAGTDVVIGARAAAWGPCPGLASIVVLDAHDEGLVQEQAPTWDAPAVAARTGPALGRALPVGHSVPDPGAAGRGRRGPLRQPGRRARRLGQAPGGRPAPVRPEDRSLLRRTGRACCATAASGSSAS